MIAGNPEHCEPSRILVHIDAIMFDLGHFEHQREICSSDQEIRLALLTLPLNRHF